jgi:hypothetical protein
VKKKSKSGRGRPPKRSRAQDKARKSGRKQHKNNKGSNNADRSTLDVALQCAAAGVPVFPLHGKDWNGKCCCGNPDCDKPGKHAREEATTDPAVIERYWTECPDDEIGVPLGSSSGFVALLIDGAAGQKALRALEKKTK